MAGELWGRNIASPVSMDGVVKVVPGEPAVLPLTPQAKFNRAQQVMFLHRFLPFVPSYVRDPNKHGGLMLERVLAFGEGPRWWAALTGQFRIQKLLSVQKGKKSEGTNPLKWFLDQSLYALGISSRIWSHESTSLTASLDLSSNKKECRARAVLHHKLEEHDVFMEVSWHDWFVQRQGSSWNTPLSISLDMASLPFTSGLRYCLGVRHNCGFPQECGNTDNTKIPWILSPGLCAKAAVSIEKRIKVWKDESAKELDWEEEPYYFYLRQPHVRLSAIGGTTFGAILADSASRAKFEMLPGENQSNENKTLNSISQAKAQRSPFSADIFASLGCTAQLGKFRRPWLDLTRLEARLDIGTVSAFENGAARLINKFYGSASDIQHRDESVSPLLAVMLQQQIVGPLCARIDSRISMNRSSSKYGLHVKEIVYGLDYSLKELGATKIFAWYSPTRQEGMVELRFLEK